MFVVSVFLFKFNLWFSCFNFHSIIHGLIDIICRSNNIISLLNEIFVVLISILIFLF